MKNVRRALLSAALLAIPAAGSAQLTGHVSIGIGLAAQTQPVYRPGFGIGPAHQSPHNGAYLGVGFSTALGNSDYYDDYGYGHHGGWDPYDCWDYRWYDPWLGCNRYYPVGYFGPWWGWHRPVWGFYGFLGWPSHRVVHHHWYGFSPFAYGGWGGYSGHYGWGWDRYRYRHRSPVVYVYDPYDGDGYATPRGYRSGGRATPRGYTDGDRIVRASPLFGPRYKENPRKVYVTDNGPEKPVSRAVPRGTRTEGVTTGRNGTRTTPDARRARPREGTKATTTRTGTRPGTRTAVPTTRRTPTRTAKPVTTRSRRPAPKPKASVPRRPVPKPKASVPRRPAPKPKASVPRRPAPKPKASVPRRPAPKPKARPPSRRSGSSKKPPPRRGGKD